MCIGVYRGVIDYVQMTTKRTNSIN